jgi:hypothetical protein
VSDYIDALDEALAAAGEDVILRRIVGTGTSAMNVDVTVRASVRRDAAAMDLVGTLAQGEDAVIISPTQITTAQWPGGHPASTAIHQADPRVPRINDTLIIQGRPRKVKMVQPILVDGELVRINMVAAG